MISSLKKLEADDDDMEHFSTQASKRLALKMARDLERLDAEKAARMPEDRQLLSVPADGWLSGPGRKVNVA